MPPLKFIDMGRKISKKRRRRFICDECNHIYQKTANGELLFYDREDYLVCYTILSVTARKYGVEILEVCFMIDHIHILLYADTCEIMADFMRDYTSVFAQAYNESVGRTGRLFHKSYGSAPKSGDKKMRSAIVYIGNNPVEKKLCVNAEDYRWNFLKYMVESGPFSERKPTNSFSRPLRRARRQVKAMAELGLYLNYAKIRSMLSTVSGNELELLTDFIISSYSPFNDKRVLGYYESWEQMVHAMHSTTDSEYDIDERFYSGSDQVYVNMIRFVRDELNLAPVRQVTVMRPEEKMRLAALLKQKTGASFYQVRRFLQMRDSVECGI